MKILSTPLLVMALTLLASPLSFAIVSPTQNTQSQNKDNSGVIQVGWQDLKGKVAPYYDPFRELTQEQIYNLSIYGRVLELQKTVPNKVTDKMVQMGEQAKAKLIAEKVDIDGLFAQREIIVAKRKKAAMATNSFLTNRKIQISGYLLALEFDQGLVTEFLLVPTVGACSHKPVPAANQLLLVKTKQPFEAGSPYLPIRVTGTLQTNQQNKNLNLVDGNKQIQMAYFIDDGIVTEL